MPVHHDFDRNRDLLLDLFGRAARPLRDHLDVVVRDVGIGFHRQIVERDGAPDEQQHGGCQDDQEAVVEGEINQCPNHLDKWRSAGAAQGAGTPDRLFDAIASNIDGVDRSRVSDVVQRIFIEHDQVRPL